MTTELEGRTIETVRAMTTEEIEREFPYAPALETPLMIVLDDGTEIFPSQDSEGNGPGQLFGRTPNGEQVAYFAQPVDQ